MGTTSGVIPLASPLAAPQLLIDTVAIPTRLQNRPLNCVTSTELPSEGTTVTITIYVKPVGIEAVAGSLAGLSFFHW